MIGQSLDRLIPEGFRANHHNDIEVFGQNGISITPMGGERVLAGVRKNGEEFPIEAQISRAAVDGEKFYTVILPDVTRRRRAEREREQFLAILGHKLRNLLQLHRMPS
jgi:PAS domain S-box-containing protein